MADVTAIHSLPFPEDSDFIEDGPAKVQELAETVDPLLAPHDAGLLASRPVSTPGTPGIIGRTYRSTDTGQLDQDNGTGWDRLWPARLTGLYADRPAAAAALNGSSFYALDKAMEWQCIAGAWVGTAAYDPLPASSLPSSPLDGQIAVYQSAAMAAVGVQWRFRYRSGGGTHKWEAAGAHDLVATDNAVVNPKATYPEIAGGPAVTCPLAGEYLITIGCTVQSTNSTPTNHFMSFDIGGTAAVDADALVDTTDNALAPRSLARTNIIKTLTAGTVLTARYRSSGNNGSADRRSISARPLRVS